MRNDRGDGQEKRKDIWLDPGFWSHYFHDHFSMLTRAYCDIVLDRLIYSFERIDQEMQTIMDEEFTRFMKEPAHDPEVDYGELAADHAISAADQHLYLMTSVKQTLLNLACVGLYHMFEQHLLFFHRKQILTQSEENLLSMLNVQEMKVRLSRGGIELGEVEAWDTVEELRLVANVVKHSEGSSAASLRQKRPDLFDYPSQRRSPENYDKDSLGTIFMPLSGNDLYVTEEDFRTYGDAIVSFWRQFGDEIRIRGGGREPLA